MLLVILRTGGKVLINDDMKIISVFDTTIAEYNLGNQIIMDAVNREIASIFESFFLYKLPYQQITHSLSCIVNESDYVFFGGTNSLSSQMNKYKQWDISLPKTIYIKNIIMLGIGWWQYQDKPNLYTQMLLKRALSKKYIHSVRDSYTEMMLKGMGFKVLNTGCPTTWHLTPEHISKICQKSRKDAVLLALTDYNQDKEKDRRILDICRKYYSKIYFWPQGVGDYRYFVKALDGKDAVVINSTLSAFDQVLISGEVDYVGTRLHAGIRALQKGCHAYIISIDNRAEEISKDINLPIVRRIEIDKLENWLNDNYYIDLNINWRAIESWRDQFR